MWYVPRISSRIYLLSSSNWITSNSSSKLFRTSVISLNEIVHHQQQQQVNNNNNDTSEQINKRLMDFFDLPQNWGKDEVKSGIFLNNSSFCYCLLFLI